MTSAQGKKKVLLVLTDGTTVDPGGHSDHPDQGLRLLEWFKNAGDDEVLEVRYVDGTRYISKRQIVRIDVED